MYFLSLETSTKVFALGLSQGEKVLRYRHIKTAQVLEDCILPAIDQMLEDAGVAFDEVNAYAIALGPGSFTSLRVGLSTIKAFAMATGKPVVGIPSLDVIAKGVDAREADEICVITDARRGKVYAALYGPKGRTSDYLLAPLEEVLRLVQGRTLFVGDALGVYRQQINEAYDKFGTSKSRTCRAMFAQEKLWVPHVKAMAALAHGRLAKKDYDDAAQLLPMYLYPQDCQVHRP